MPPDSPFATTTRRFVRRWAFALSAAVGIAAVLVGLRLWTDHQLDAPIDVEYAAFLDVLAQRSAQARGYRASYRHHFGRDAVASRHFEQVCATMLRMAESDGAAVPSSHAAMADGCRRLIPKYAGDALPRD